MAYTKSYTAWHDFPDTTTPILASKLQNMDDGVYNAVTRTGDTMTGTLRLWGPVYDAGRDGAVGDGVTDDTAAIQATINAVSALGGGIILFSADTYVINGTLDLRNTSGVHLMGAGSFRDIYSVHGSASPNVGTVFKRTSGVGTMLRMGTVLGTANSAIGQKVTGISFDGGGLAATGILVESLRGGVIDDVMIRQCTSVALDITTVDLAGDDNTQHCVFSNIGINGGTNGIGMQVGVNTVPPSGNVSLCAFDNIMIVHVNGAGSIWEDCDSNTISYLGSFSVGTGVSVDLQGANDLGYCRGNYFSFIQTLLAGGVVSRGTGLAFPAIDNVIENYSLENGAAATPTIETGSSLYYKTDRGNFHFGSPHLRNTTDALIARNAADSADVNLVKLDSANAVNIADGGENVYVGINSTTSENPELRVYGYRTGVGVKYGSVSIDTSGNLNVVTNTGQVLSLAGLGGMLLNWASQADVSLFAGSSGSTTNRNLVITGWDGAVAQSATMKVSSGGVFQVTPPTAGVQIGSTSANKVGFYGQTPASKPSAYTPTNVTTDRAYDANATTIDELSDVLGTLIADLQSLGLIG